MSMLYRVGYDLLAGRGFELRRHHAARRQRVLASRGVDLVLDVGAAVGSYGAELRRFGYAGSIVSFEPRADAFAQLRSRIEGDTRWAAHQCALGPEAGESVINVASNGDSSSLLPMLDSHVAASPQVTMTGTETIRVEQLDELVGAEVAAAEAPFLKIDTQGFEREVLAGSVFSLPRLVGIQLELSFTPLYEGGMLVDEALSWAYDNGFHLVGLEQGYAAPSGELLQSDGVFVRS